MKLQPQFARVLALLFGAALFSLPAAAQRVTSAFRQDRPQRKEERREQRQQRQQEKQQKQQGNKSGSAANNRPPNAAPSPVRPNTQPAPRVTPPSPPPSRDFAPRGNRNAGPPFGGGAQASLERLRNMSPQERERVLQNNQVFHSKSPEEQNRIRQNFQRWDRLNPQQKQDLLERERNWHSMTLEQRDHLRSDVIPKWQQLPPDRRQAIHQRLQILKNMPESARNQRLNDPNFTRGMSPEDQSMLHDLARLRVGGAPDPPPEP